MPSIKIIITNIRMNLLIWSSYFQLCSLNLKLCTALVNLCKSSLKHCREMVSIQVASLKWIQHHPFNSSSRTFWVKKLLVTQKTIWERLILTASKVMIILKPTTTQFTTKINKKVLDPTKQLYPRIGLKVSPSLRSKYRRIKCRSWVWKDKHFRISCLPVNNHRVLLMYLWLKIWITISRRKVNRVSGASKHLGPNL